MTPGFSKTLLWSVGSVVALTVAALLFVPNVDVRIRESQVREAIQARVPLSHTTDLGSVEVRDADVRFLTEGETGAIGIEVDIRVDSFGLGGTGRADTISRLRYERGAFYLTDLKLDDFEVTPTAATRIKLLAWRKAVETFLDQLGEDIRDKDGEAAFEEFLKSREALGPILREALDDALGTIPVYRLDGSAAERAIWLALKDIRFDDRVAIVTLSPSRAILILATGFLALLIGGLVLWTMWQGRRPANFENTY